jgi:Uma2 family endonuclease
MSSPATTIRHILGPADRGRSLSDEAFAEAEFVRPWRYEREGGRLVVMAPDSREHDDCAETVRDYLGAYRLARRDLVDRVVSDCWIRVPEGTDRIADIAVFLVTAEEGPDRPDRIPDLVYEVVSPDRESRERDYVLKRREYRMLGVREHVIIDRFRSRFTIYRKGQEGYRKTVIRKAGEGAYGTPLLPGFRVILDEVS